MKRLMCAALVAAAAIAAIYGYAVFVSLEPDVRKWTQDARFFFAFISSMAGLLAATGLLTLWEGM